MTFIYWPHYEIKKIDNISDLRTIFGDEGLADEFNWCFLSTSGPHGMYTNLNELFVEGEYGYKPESITVLVIHPRLVVVRYGHIDVSPADIPYLRKLVTSSIDAVKKSQEGNTEKER